MMAVRDPVTNKEAKRGSEKNEWNLSLKEELDSIERNDTRTDTELRPGKDAFRVRKY